MSTYCVFLDFCREPASPCMLTSNIRGRPVPSWISPELHGAEICLLALLLFGETLLHLLKSCRRNLFLLSHKRSLKNAFVFFFLISFVSYYHVIIFICILQVRKQAEVIVKLGFELRSSGSKFHVISFVLSFLLQM